MIFGNIKKRIFISNHVKKGIPEIKQLLEEISKRSKILAICPTPTQNSWLGISRATNNLFPKNCFNFPQYYSEAVYNETELKAIVALIIELNFEKVVFSGYCSYFEIIIETLKRLKKSVFIALIYHGSLSELAGAPRMVKDFLGLINLFKNKKIDRIGFIKKDLDLCINKIFQIHTVDLILPPPDVSNVIREKSIKREHLHIGVFANNQMRKNVHNQVAAALMMEKSIVHASDSGEYGYLSRNRIINYPRCVPWNQFMFTLAQMDINLYNTYTESWGQLVVESLSLDIPCLTNNSSGVLDYLQELKEILVVNEHDNPYAIYERIKVVLEKKDEVKVLSSKYIRILKESAEMKLYNFLNC